MSSQQEDADKILLPCRKAFCSKCNEFAFHVNVAGSWLCNICGRDSELVASVKPTAVLNVEGKPLIAAIGHQTSWRVLQALNRTGKARLSQIAAGSKLSETGAKKALQRLYWANLVLRFDSLFKNSTLWTLNMANPVTARILDILQLLSPEDKS